MTVTERSYEGELVLDHRASPGFTEEQSRKLGYGDKAVGSTLFEAPTRTCNHCGTVVLINPNRVRARARCNHCSMYICDGCDFERHQSDYVHMTKQDKAEQMRKGVLNG